MVSKPNSALNTKSIARFGAINTIYQLNTLYGVTLEQLIENTLKFYRDAKICEDLSLDQGVKLKINQNYFKELVLYSHQHQANINQIIEQYLTEKWSLKTLSPLLLALLQVAIGEFNNFAKTPKRVIINEYTDIANDLLNANEVGFVNSVLDNYAKTINPN